MKFDHTKKIHEQISPESWFQGHYCDRFTFESGSCACLVGWVRLKHNVHAMAFGCRESHPEYDKDISKIEAVLGTGVNVPNWNDSHSFSDVLELFKKVDL